MNEVIDAFRNLIPSGSKTSGRGWIQFNCPACSDRHKRGGFKETSTGGFRYRCQNGGCRYEQKTGWEPDNGFRGRARRLFELMGGDISDISKSILDGPSRTITKNYDMSDDEERRAWIAKMCSDFTEEAASPRLYTPRGKDLEVALDFPVVPLPKDSVYLWDATTVDALDAQRYAEKRCMSFISHVQLIPGECPLLWSPKYKRHVIVPFIDKGEVIGWIARAIDTDSEFPHIKCPNFPSDYMLNQHLRYTQKIILVMEGAFDALALRGMCTFGNVVSKRQINLLNQLARSGRTIALIPDFKKDEWRSYYRTAKENGWYLSVPEWPGDDGRYAVDYIKDPGDSITRNGLLYTIETIMNSITNNYGYAEHILLRRSR